MGGLQCQVLAIPKLMNIVLLNIPSKFKEMERTKIAATLGS